MMTTLPGPGLTSVAFLQLQSDEMAPLGPVALEGPGRPGRENAGREIAPELTAPDRSPAGDVVAELLRRHLRGCHGARQGWKNKRLSSSRIRAAVVAQR